MKSKVSIIITTYKRSMSVLCRAIKSAINQSYSNIEIIVVNDYPAYRQIIDLTIKEHQFDVKIIHNTENIGACESRNVAINKACGEYIALLDDDDEWTPDKIEMQVAVMDCKTAMVYCSGQGVYTDGSVIELSFIRDCTDNPLPSILAENCIGGCSFPLIRRSILLQVGSFDSTFKSAQDYDLWIRIASKYPIKFVNRHLVNYYITTDSITTNFDNRLQGYSRLLQKHNLLYRENINSAVRFYANVIFTCLKNKQIISALSFLRKSFQYFPKNFSIIKILLIALIKKMI